jgi:RES domain-containing protein
MRVWRICSRRFRTFDGEGASLHGGRWNFPGVPLVYTSQSLSLAAMELLAHLDPRLVPPNLVSIEVEIPVDLEISRIGENQLPANWRTYPAPEGLQEMGTRWARAGRTVALSVPSVLIPEERNYLLHPAHPGFRRLRISRPRAFRLDARLFG